MLNARPIVHANNLYSSPRWLLLLDFLVLIVLLLCIVDPFLEVFELSVVIFQELHLELVLVFVVETQERTFSNAF